MPNPMLVEQHEYHIGDQSIIEDPMLRVIDGIMDPAEAFDWVSFLSTLYHRRFSSCLATSKAFSYLYDLPFM